MPPIRDDEEQLHESAILTRAIENVFRKLIHFLVGRISLVKLQEMIRFIYIEESEAKLRKEKPGRDVSLTRLALLTGLDTRTLAKTRNSEGYRKPLFREERFVKSMTPESCVLDVWTSNAEFLDSDSGEPKILPLHGEMNSFEKLVKESVSSRGLTAQSILASLVNNQAVILDDSMQTVQLIEKIQAPFRSGDQWGVFDIGMLQICGLLDTVFHNFRVAKNGGIAFFDQGCWTHRLSRSNRLGFQQKMRDFLEKCRDEAWVEVGNLEEKASHNEQLTAGIFMYYFEDDTKIRN